MDFTLYDLKQGPGPGRGVVEPPDVDARGLVVLLITQRSLQRQPAPAAASR